MATQQYSFNGCADITVQSSGSSTRWATEGTEGHRASSTRTNRSSGLGKVGEQARAYDLDLLDWRASDCHAASEAANDITGRARGRRRRCAGTCRCRGCGCTHNRRQTAADCDFYAADRLANSLEVANIVPVKTNIQSGQYAVGRAIQSKCRSYCQTRSRRGGQSGKAYFQCAVTCRTLRSLRTLGTGGSGSACCPGSTRCTGFTLNALRTLRPDGAD